MFRSIFNPEATFWRWMARLTDILSLSLLWLFLSLPILTLGASTAALYDVCARCLRGEDPHPMRRFFTTFKRELPSSLLLTVICIPLLSLAFYGFSILWNASLAELQGAPILMAAYFVVLLIPTGAFCWLFPILSRFSMKPLSLFMAALQFSVGHLPSTLAILIFTSVAVILSDLFLVPLLVFPCVTALFWTRLMEPVFRKYMPGEAGEEENGGAEKEPGE